MIELLIILAFLILCIFIIKNIKQPVALLLKNVQKQYLITDLPQEVLTQQRAILDNYSQIKQIISIIYFSVDKIDNYSQLNLIIEIVYTSVDNFDRNFDNSLYIISKENEYKQTQYFMTSACYDTLEATFKEYENKTKYWPGDEDKDKNKDNIEKINKDLKF